MYKKLLIWLLLLVSSEAARSQDSIRVQFLYGSRPAKKYRDTEKKWFGGVLGGHVGIEADSGRFYSFEVHGKNKLFAGRPDNSIFRVETADQFWAVMKTQEDSIKKTTVVIPVTPVQIQKLDSIAAAYQRQVPYCYAVFGMRCGASTYDLLAQIGIFPHYSHFKTCLKIFYPRKLRKRVISMAEKNNWTILHSEGTPKRKWEKDVGKSITVRS